MLKFIRDILLVLLAFSCTYYTNEPVKIPEPPRSDETEHLIAEYVATPPNTIRSAYWTTADYLLVDLQNLVEGQQPAEENYLNMSNMFDGIGDFNRGDSSGLKLKAAYDDAFVYILAEWTDQRLHASGPTWMYNGPIDPRQPAADTAGWTLQRASDKLILSFEGASIEDIWQWDLALSEPMGFAVDKVVENGNETYDAGDRMFIENGEEGPEFEWDGVQQELTREPGGFTLLDPAYYILNKTPFAGDIENGYDIYDEECALCHGYNGDGQGYDWNTGLRLNVEGVLNRMSRNGFALFAGANEHSGASHFTPLSDTEKDDLIAYIRGLAGVPGYYLDSPTGSSADIQTISSINLAKVSRSTDNPGITVLFRRALNTGSSDDIIFDPVIGEYTFSAALSDGDLLNRVGENELTLKFKTR
ncbi:MAG: hypothetical protein JXQ90_12185 [Cyclobacteriaceae bacterium]